MSGRQPKYYIVVGAPGTGKSTWVANNMVKKETGNAIVYKDAAYMDDKAFSFLTLKSQSNWRQGAPKHQPVRCKIGGDDQDDYQDLLKWILEKNFTNGLLVVDDAGEFEDGVSSKRFKKIMRMRRHDRLDLVMIYHGLTDVPIDNFKYANYLILFETTDNFFYKKNKISNFDLMVSANEKLKENIQKGDYYTPVIVNLRMPRVNRP